MTSQCPCFELSMGKPVPFDTHLHIRYYSRGACHSKFRSWLQKKKGKVLRARFDLYPPGA